MVKTDYYAGAGFALDLLARSKYHKQFILGDYFSTEILPALWTNQARFYLTEEDIPTAMVTWAWLSAKVEREIHATGRSLTRQEWKCGNRLFFNDWVTPYNNIREVLHDMTHTVFPNEIATSVRRNCDGSVRRISRWTGIKVRRTVSAR